MPHRLLLKPMLEKKASDYCQCYYCINGKAVSNFSSIRRFEVSYNCKNVSVDLEIEYPVSARCPANKANPALF